MEELVEMVKYANTISYQRKREGCIQKCSIKEILNGLEMLFRTFNEDYFESKVYCLLCNLMSVY